MVGQGLHRVDQRGARPAAVRRALPAAHPAGPRPLHAGRHGRAAAPGGDGARRRAARVRVLLLLVQRPPPAGVAARGAAGRPLDRPAVLPDVGQRELDPALGRFGGRGPDVAGLPRVGRGRAGCRVPAALRRPPLHPARGAAGADGLPRRAGPARGGQALAQAVRSRRRGPAVRDGPELRRPRPGAGGHGRRRRVPAAQGDGRAADAQRRAVDAGPFGDHAGVRLRRGGGRRPTSRPRPTR